MTRYLTTQQVVLLNAVVTGAQGGVRDLGLVDAAVGRAQSGFGDVETFPTLLSKAAALLHGLSSTQGFQDGNKRTAWAAAEVFLELNSVPMLEDIAPVVAEAFVLAVAKDLLSLPRAEEWLELHVEPEGGRLDYAHLIYRVEWHGGAQPWHGQFVGLSGINQAELPATEVLNVVLRLLRSPRDVGRSRTIEIDLLSDGPVPTAAIRDEGGVIRFDIAPPATGHPYHRRGVQAITVRQELTLDAWDEGRSWVRVRVAGREVARLPLVITSMPMVAPDSAEALID
ncbi:hypothetical protein DQ239_18555 [Blastococcus sp. TF02-09]|uniref:type II toxin-antitoxin system death-on-curing family toxin n=1 Tax=Blastococcus sp. TF02-09 TaxID=2250576 RepID=UPI000DE9FD25|nr:Fic family protein [Blastococcus sp. TF02-9]RBY74795.1 hypothetical protein DQ239_18555 [Blastococcus sp. TF02-9]